MKRPCRVGQFTVASWPVEVSVGSWEVFRLDPNAASGIEPDIWNLAQKVASSALVLRRMMAWPQGAALVTLLRWDGDLSARLLTPAPMSRT